MARETWATRVGFILAAVGSAVGLGNIWRFPWVTAENGGSAFLAMYLGIVLLVGVPGLLAMFVVGRRAKRNPVGALQQLSGSDRWGLAGGFLVFSSLVLISFYSVVGGWILRYLGESLLGVVAGSAPYFADPGASFGAASVGLDAVAFHLVFLALTAFVVVAGIRRGIEVATKWMMPAIFALLVGLAAWASTQAGAAEAYAFYLRFDTSVIRENFFGLLGPAAGQALFTLSLGVGTMITYASYLDEDRSLPFDGASVAVLNTVVGVLAGLVVFPLLFSLGIEPGETGTGAGALFVGLAGAFAQLPAGALVATAFFAVVALAALSSAISILEISVSFLVDEYDLPRRRAAATVGGLVAVTGSVCALNAGVFGFVAGTLVDILLTIGLAVCLVFVGWVMGRDALVEFRKGAGPVGRAVATPWLFAVGVLLPTFLVFTLLTTFNVDAEIGFWPTVAAAVAVAGAAFAGLRGERSLV
ncbi:sodium-dependent transporter [Halogeometricum sp. S1BR25-6]|uniref:Sodium-dependent transporter n=1 Tax=Halogeometricum salsisoli TaxID=2950536 RepID=A0ABU2GEV0_9EURY|nr:sodium-dependent transporter [Halogeometricum sp. S1BR25-6]MDS0299340.1 sodium-dependent transporter [Halogeometricum sp. S1BR25-6]